MNEPGAPTNEFTEPNQAHHDGNPDYQKLHPEAIASPDIAHEVAIESKAIHEAILLAERSGDSRAVSELRLRASEVEEHVEKTIELREKLQEAVQSYISGTFADQLQRFCEITGKGRVIEHGLGDDYWIYRGLFRDKEYAGEIWETYEQYATNNPLPLISKLSAEVRKGIGNYLESVNDAKFLRAVLDDDAFHRLLEELKYPDSPGYDSTAPKEKPEYQYPANSPGEREYYFELEIQPMDLEPRLSHRNALETAPELERLIRSAADPETLWLAGRLTELHGRSAMMLRSGKTRKQLEQAK